jgi:hypothetical protein
MPAANAGLIIGLPFQRSISSTEQQGDMVGDLRRHFVREHEVTELLERLQQ